MIPVFKPRYDKRRILDELGSVLDSGWTGLGPKTAEFEKRVADYVGTSYSVAVNSCTAALHLAVECLNLHEGASVAVPDITFASSAAAVLYAGLTPRLLPVDEETLCMDLNALEGALNDDDRIRAVIVVHYSGNTCDIDRLIDLCRSRGVALIEDCAHAFGSRCGGRHVGTFGQLGCFSFHAVKNLAIADGGAVVGLGVYEERLRSLRWMGIDRSTYDRSDARRYSYSYEISELGYKYHMNDVAAVIGLANLNDVDACNGRRRSIYETYLRELPELRIQRVRTGVASSHHLVACQVEGRDSLIEHMAARGVQIGVHYKPLSMFRLFQGYADEETKRRGMRIFSRLATLPCYPDLSASELATVIDGVRRFMRPEASTQEPALAAQDPGL